jgi:hypothetical protein
MDGFGDRAIHILEISGKAKRAVEEHKTKVNSEHPSHHHIRTKWIPNQASTKTKGKDQVGIHSYLTRPVIPLAGPSEITTPPKTPKTPSKPFFFYLPTNLNSNHLNGT